MPGGGSGTETAARPVRRKVAMAARLLGIGAALVIFVRLADEVTEGDTHAFDRALLLALRNSADPNDPLGPVWLESAARDITSLGGYPVLILVSLAVTGFLFAVRKHRAALLVLVAVAGGMLLTTVLKIGYDRPRPELVPHGVEVYTKSFPSGHAMLSAVTYLTLAALLARVQPSRGVRAYLLAVAVLLTALIGLSRVYLGVHWPTDVLGGWCAGGAWAMICWFLASRLETGGEAGPPRSVPPLDPDRQRRAAGRGRDPDDPG